MSVRRDTDPGALARQLDESRARTAALYASAIDGVIAMDGEGLVVDLNDAALAMFGLEGRDVVGQRLADLIIPPEHRDAHHRGLTRIAAGGESRVMGQRLELEALHADGRRMPVELSIAKVSSGSRLLFVGYIRDISARLADERALREQYRLAAFGRDVGLAITSAMSLEEMLTACTDTVVDHLGAAFARIWIMEEDRRTLRLRASSGIYTHTDGEHSRIPVGKYKIGQIAADQRPHLTNSVIGDPQVHDQDWAQREKMVAFAGYPLVVENRTVGVLAMFSRSALSKSAIESMKSVVGSIANAIERKRMEFDLRRYADELVHADERKNEFLAMLGHELRNPLAPLRSAFDLIRLGHVEDATLAIMDKQLGHMSRLVDDLLDIARVVRGNLKLERHPLSLREILESCVEANRTLLGSRRIQMEFREPTELMVMADEMRLTQVFNNVLQNAVKYSDADSEISLVTFAENAHAVVEVHDRGVGIEADFLPHVFSLFTQADRSLDRASGGLGLGLALASRVVEQHGGSIKAYSDGADRGSLFTVRLPLTTRPSTETSEDSARPTQTQAARRRVLVVDDNVDAATGIARLITALGDHAVSLAHDGEQALVRAREDRPDLVLLDIGLPRMDGLEVARQLRAMEGTENTLVVALTGYGGEDDQRNALDAGCDAHRVKPMDVDELITLLDTHRGDG